jgi:membrane protein implicated in regulation of membrane protease activity
LGVLAHLRRGARGRRGRDAWLLPGGCRARRPPAALVAAVGGSLTLQLIVFIIGAIASLAFIRPVARRHLHTPPKIRTGTAALIGARATVLQRVDAGGGRVKIGGEEWTARSYDEDDVYEEGARVEVLKIEGATALVSTRRS